MATRAQTARVKKDFLVVFARCGNVTEAAEQIGAERRRVYDWKETDPAFVLAFAEAELEAVDRLEQEARRRAVQGVRREKGIYHDGERIDTEIITEFSDTLLIFLLKGAAPDKYRERQDINLQSTARLRIDIDGDRNSGD